MIGSDPGWGDWSGEEKTIEAQEASFALNMNSLRSIGGKSSALEESQVEEA